MKSLFLANAIATSLGITPSGQLPERHGQICLANDSLLSQSTYVEDLSTYAIGYTDPNRNRLEALLNFLAPKRTSGRIAKVTKYDENEPFEVIDWRKVKREILGQFAEVRQRTSTKVDRTIPNRGLTIRLDKDQLKDKPNWQNMHTQWLLDLLKKASILEVLAMYDALAVTDTWTWDNAANPDLQVKSTMIDVVAPLIGFKPNRAIYGESATLKRQQSYEAQDNAGGFARAMLMSDQQIASAIGMDRMLTNAERYQNDAGVKQTFLGSTALFFTSVDGESPEDPSNVVRHVSTASFGSGEYAVYVHEEGVKTVFITVENYELFATQHTGGVLKATIQ
jgi:hypothetical protein